MKYWNTSPQVSTGCSGSITSFWYCRPRDPAHRYIRTPPKSPFEEVSLQLPARQTDICGVQRCQIKIPNAPRCTSRRCTFNGSKIAICSSGLQNSPVKLKRSSQSLWTESRFPHSRTLQSLVWPSYWCSSTSSPIKKNSSPSTGPQLATPLPDNLKTRSWGPSHHQRKNVRAVPEQPWHS